jgi:hypothetical protein
MDKSELSSKPVYLANNTSELSSSLRSRGHHFSLVSDHHHLHRHGGINSSESGSMGQSALLKSSLRNRGGDDSQKIQELVEEED